MSDLFHEAIPLEFIEAVFKVMNECPQHIFQVLTKRSANLLKCAPELTWSDNIWMGVTVENDEFLSRIDDLRQVPAKVRWLSLEPLLGPIPNLNLHGIDWVVVGGEHANNFRPMDIAWAIDIKNQCIEKSVAVFLKQFSGMHPKSLGDNLDGRQWHEYPLEAREAA
jgi:protein gp37